MRRFLADTTAGRQALINASTNADVDTLNEVIRAQRIAEGLVDDTRTTRLSRGDTVGVGDTIIARENAKLYTSEVAVSSTRIATQIFGGNGFMEEYPVARFYRDAKILEIGEGTSEVQRMVIARHLGLPV
mgnify:CR=1 FL=1